jgi:tetratricopeptide (TPR) repeat protein
MSKLLYSARAVSILLAVAFSMLHVTNAIAIETDLPGIDDQSLFSPTFFSALDAANRAGDPVPQLEAVHQKFRTPAEQGETELTIARVYCQRTGLVDPLKSIKWYDKALVRNLPATALAKQFILRGNMHERLGRHEEALADYIRGLLTCLQFNLPESWPNQDGTGKLRPPPRSDGPDLVGEQPAEQRLAERQQAADYRRESEMTRREQDLLQARYYYVDAILRVMKTKQLVETDLRAAAEKLTNRKDRVDDLLRRVRKPNPRPWP